MPWSSTSCALPRRKKTTAGDLSPETAQATETSITTEMTETPVKKLPAKTIKRGTPVSMEELVQISRKMAGEPLDKIAIAAGYFTEVTTTETGEVEIKCDLSDQLAYTQALLIANGNEFSPPTRSARRHNRRPRLKIGKTGIIVVGGRYSELAGFAFGENVETYVHLSAEKGRITITADTSSPGQDGEQDPSSEVEYETPDLTDLDSED